MRLRTIALGVALVCSFSSAADARRNVIRPAAKSVKVKKFKAKKFKHQKIAKARQH